MAPTVKPLQGDSKTVESLRGDVKSPIKKNTWAVILPYLTLDKMFTNKN